MRINGHTELAIENCNSTLRIGREKRGVLDLEEQMADFYDQLSGPLSRYVICLGVVPAEVEEVMQASFVRLYEYLLAGNKVASPRAWVFQVAHNIAMNEHKRSRFAAETDPEELARLYEQRTSPAPSPEELLLEKEKMARVREAIASLTEFQQQCLYLRAEGFRYREIGDVLGVGISTVTESLRTVVKKLSRGSGA